MQRVYVCIMSDPGEKPSQVFTTVSKLAGAPPCRPLHTLLMILWIQNSHATGWGGVGVSVKIIKVKDSRHEEVSLAHLGWYPVTAIGHISQQISIIQYTI